MHIFWWVLGAGLAAVWVDRLQDAARGMKRVADITRPEWDRLPERMPRVSIVVRRVALAKRPLGRSELKRFTDWSDGQPESELNFKFYRQATNKIAGISDETAAFLRGFF